MWPTWEGDAETGRSFRSTTVHATTCQGVGRTYLLRVPHLADARLVALPFM